ncbi:Zn-ribbon domain-containing OB-fold protein [Microbacterium album]|uniref:ChsH2 C-terminal OB-fold domain-containing protein n=1 Tax=Microbacterium album TaxID=2053191 RepID=A0A917MMF7_9MICO|nr:OB-fold domain-containing protein [Microbacterium album]GGH48464.1 hypothetical protein GCM10010921_25940 [Microbacterium album]
MELSQLIEDLRERPSVQIEDNGDVVLKGSRCGGCDALAFPYRDACHKCGERTPEDTALGGAGELYSWTRVHVSSTLPTPYALGYVDLAGPGTGVRVFTQLVPATGDWQVGQKVKAVIADDVAGGWAFAQDTGEQEHA